VVQHTWGEALALLQNDPIKGFAALIAGVGPDGKTAGPAGAAQAAGEAHIGSVGGETDAVSASFTRPSNATPYTAKDVVGNMGTAAMMTFANMARV
jgi:hypothetical protein